MTTGVRDIVCFIQPTGNSAFITRQMLKTLNLNANRLIVFNHPNFEEAENGYCLETNAEYISVTISIQHSKGHEASPVLKEIVSKAFFDLNIDQYLFWYHTAEALDWTNHLFPSATIFHCSDVVPSVRPNSYLNVLLRDADVVVTEGYSAYEYLKGSRENTFYIAPTVDVDHFYEARYYKKDPIDQVSIPRPRIGYCAFPNDPIDYGLLTTIADARPKWQLIITGENNVRSNDKISGYRNIHFLGEKSYDQLPDYISGWDVCFIPMQQEAGRFMNPPQCWQSIVAGKAVVCTPLPDVIRSYGNKALIHIAGTPAEFISKIQLELTRRDRSDWQIAVSEFIHHESIDPAVQKLSEHLHDRFNFESVYSIDRNILKRQGHASASNE